MYYWDEKIDKKQRIITYETFLTVQKVIESLPLPCKNENGSITFLKPVEREIPKMTYQYFIKWIVPKVVQQLKRQLSPREIDLYY